MDDLIVSQQGLAAMAQNNGLEQAIKPLVREVHLFDTYIAGVSYLDDKTVLQRLKIGDKLVMKREENKFDDKAILLLTHEGQKIGYVPEKDNVIFSRLMDAGKMLIASIKNIRAYSTDYQLISIGIYLVDF